jgi:PAS domain S-box-containing protein
MNSRDQTDDNDFIIQSFSRITLIDNIYSSVSDAESSRKGYFTTNDRELLEPYYIAAGSIDSLLNTLKKLSSDNPTQLANTDTLKALITERFRILKEGIDIQTTSSSPSGINPNTQKNIFDKGKIVQKNIRNLTARMQHEEEETLQQKNELAEQGYKFTYFVLLGGILISSVIFITVFIILRKKASKTFDSENQEISREELEYIVKERTAEISQINHKLYQKIDQLEKTEGALKRSEQYYRMMFEQAHDAIIIFSPDEETVLDVNKRACELYGMRRDEFIGLSLKSISKNIPEGIENIKSTLQKGFYHSYQCVHYKKDFTEMLIETNASVINYPGQSAILSINRDITERILKVI